MGARSRFKDGYSRATKPISGAPGRTGRALKRHGKKAGKLLHAGHYHLPGIVAALGVLSTASIRDRKRNKSLAMRAGAGVGRAGKALSAKQKAALKKAQAASAAARKAKKAIARKIGR